MSTPMIKKHNNFRYEYFDSILFQTFAGHFVPLALFYLFFPEIQSKLAVSISILGAWFLFFATPTIILYINHSGKSKGKVLKFAKDALIIHSKESTSEISFYKITQVILNVSPPSYDGRVDFLFFGKYYYATLVLDDGRNINLSCLLLGDKYDVFPDRTLKFKKVGFPLIG